MPGRWYSELFDIAADQYGFVTTEDLQLLGGNTQVLVDMRRHGHVDRVAHGLYRFHSFPAGPLDEFMQATLWPRRLGVISHDSALDLWDLCDVNPAKIHVTVPKAARLRRATPPEYVVHTRDLEPNGRIASADLAARFERTIVEFLDLVEAAKHYPCAKKAWVEFLGEHPNPLIDRVE
jgi:predicted transcriptional regulator of viral defense system